MYRSSTAYRLAGQYAPMAEQVAYRSAVEYRPEDHTYRLKRPRPGIFVQPYRNANDYRTDQLQYRVGFDDPLLEAASGIDAHTLVVTLDLTDAMTAVDVDKASVHVVPIYENQDYVTFLEGTAGDLDVSGADTSSGVDTQAQGIAVTSSDSGRFWYGSQQTYRIDVDYQAQKQYRGAGAYANISHPVQADTASGADVTVSFDNAVTVADAVAFLEAHGIDLSSADVSTSSTDVLVDLIVVAADVAAGTDLDIGGDRTTVSEDGFEVSFATIGPFGEVAQHLSHIAVNRYRSMPSGVRRR